MKAARRRSSRSGLIKPMIFDCRRFKKCLSKGDSKDIDDNGDEEKAVAVDQLAIVVQRSKLMP